MHQFITAGFHARLLVPIQTFVLFPEDVFLGSGTHGLEIAELIGQGSDISWTQSSKT